MVGIDSTEQLLEGAVPSAAGHRVSLRDAFRGIWVNAERYRSTHCPAVWQVMGLGVQPTMDAVAGNVMTLIASF